MGRDAVCRLQACRRLGQLSTNVQHGWLHGRQAARALRWHERGYGPGPGCGLGPEAVGARREGVVGVVRKGDTYIETYISKGLYGARADPDRATMV